MEFRVLGPLEVGAGAAPLPVTAPGQQALLAALLLRANQVVRTERLIDELWASTPAARAADPGGRPGAVAAGRAAAGTEPGRLDAGRAPTAAPPADRHLHRPAGRARPARGATGSRRAGTGGRLRGPRRRRDGQIHFGGPGSPPGRRALSRRPALLRPARCRDGIGATWRPRGPLAVSAGVRGPRRRHAPRCG